MLMAAVTISGGMATPVIGEITVRSRSRRSISVLTTPATARSTGTATVPGVNSVTTTNGMVVLLFCAVAREERATPNVATPSPSAKSFFMDYLCGGKKMFRI